MVNREGFGGNGPWLGVLREDFARVERLATFLGQLCSPSLGVCSK